MREKFQKERRTSINANSTYSLAAEFEINLKHQFSLKYYQKGFFKS